MSSDHGYMIYGNTFQNIYFCTESHVVLIEIPCPPFVQIFPQAVDEFSIQVISGITQKLLGTQEVNT